MPALKACKVGYHKVQRLRSVCVRMSPKVRRCKHGARLASGKCPKAAMKPHVNAHIVAFRRRQALNSNRQYGPIDHRAMLARKGARRSSRKK